MYRRPHKKIKFTTVFIIIAAIAYFFPGLLNDNNNSAAKNSSDNKPRTEQTSQTKSPSADQNTNSNEQSNTTNTQTKPEADPISLAKQTYHSGQPAMITINNDQPEGLNTTDFANSHIDFSNLDTQNRTGQATAYLTRDNLGNSNQRHRQEWQPTGWHNQLKTIDGKRIYPQNRGHLIAYTLSFNLDQNGHPQKNASGSEDNPKNLFTQSAYSNQVLMQIPEDAVREALENNKKVVYQVTPIFRNNEKMARGVWVQGQSTDGSLKFNRYIYNVQDQLQFNYQTGASQVNSDFNVPAQ